MSGKPTRTSGRGRESQPHVLDWSVVQPEGHRGVHPEVREWSGGPPLGPGVVGRPTHRFGRCREAHP